MSEDSTGADIDAADGAAGPQRIAQRFWRPIGTQRVLQIVLGMFWILDAALQFQPFMFGRDFVTTFILPNASGQPAVVSWVITNIGHFIEPHIAAWNTFFAVIQLVIGVGLLFPRTVRPALGISFAWVLGVWVLGEGLGMVLTGTASALSGAPGSVLIYGLIGLMAWPNHRADDDASVGVDSSASARGLGASITPLLVWAGYWTLAAVLFLLPQNRTKGSISGAISDMASGNPSWFDHFLNSLASGLSSVGSAGGWVLAIVSLTLGFGPLLARRPGIFLAAGAVLSFVMWVVAQGWIGGIFSGSGTDPNTGPLIIVLALAMTPAFVAAPYAVRTPLVEGWRRHGVWIGIGLSLVALALFLSVVYPVAPAQSSDSSMSGMSDMSGMSGMSGMTGNSDSMSSSASTASCTGTNHSGLDVTNSPLMQMAGPGTNMNMNGADASAAAGLNSTKANWHYTGPALPTAESQVLLADGGNSGGKIHMARSGCAKEPTFSEQIGATQYVQATSRAVASLDTPATAVAAGYEAVSPTDYPVVYYVNPTTVTANQSSDRALNASAVDGLVYATTPSGEQVLAAAMYLLPDSLADEPPMPYGSLVQWHRRTGLCVPETGSPALPLAISGFAPCAAGSTIGSTPYMSMVWQIPVAGGPLATQPPDIQIVEAATMQTSS
jgi:hypothetical protein